MVKAATIITLLIPSSRVVDATQLDVDLSKRLSSTLVELVDAAVDFVEAAVHHIEAPVHALAKWSSRSSVQLFSPPPCCQLVATSRAVTRRMK